MVRAEITGIVSKVVPEKMINNNRIMYVDIADNHTYFKNNKYEKSTSFYTLQLFNKQIDSFIDKLKKGNLVHVFGFMKSFFGKDKIKKTFIIPFVVESISKQDAVELFDYDWLNDNEGVIDGL